jgi:hypothetical protein
MICKSCACDADWQSRNEQPDPFETCEMDGCEGHDSCKGCDCQHNPVKEGQIKSG